MTERILGDYNLIKELGTGSMGQVYLAEHRFMKRHFAVKILPEMLTQDRATLQRFEEEVGALSTLDHPNIAKTVNVSFADGHYFLVSDCVVDEMGESTNLAKYLQAHRELNDDELYGILKQVAEALDYAHQRVTHLCLKPNNILFGKKGQVFITDFGLSKIMGPSQVMSATMKAVSASVDSPDKLHNTFMQNFMCLAPEQKQAGSRVGPEVDAYAFGTIAYLALMKRYPEGIFAMPSGRKYQWQKLLEVCLLQDPAGRPKLLVPALEKVLSKVPAPAVAAAVSEEPKPILHDREIERPEVDHDPAAIFQVDTTVVQYTPEKREASNVEPIMTEMKVIEAGTYWQGSNDGNRDEMPRHHVALKSFAIDIHPITNDQFLRFLDAMGGEKDANHNDIIRLKDSRIKRSAGKIVIESGYSKHPVVGVTWYGAVAYAKWVGKRLPTEAEWEIAAKAGDDGAIFPSGAHDLEKSEANFFSSDTTPVMSYAPNTAGLYDMSGNVYEWCSDWYSYNYYDAASQEPENPKGPLQGVYRVLRGGCWKSLKEDLRCSRRHRNNPGTVNSTYGFRCATDVG